MKQQVDTLVAIPSKRLFLSIIADYDLNSSICELVDNAFDVWTRSKRKIPSESMWSWTMMPASSGSSIMPAG